MIEIFYMETKNEIRLNSTDIEHSPSKFKHIVQRVQIGLGRSECYDIIPIWHSESKNPLLRLRMTRLPISKKRMKNTMLYIIRFQN